MNDDSVSQVPFQIKPFQIDIVAPSSGIQFYKDGIIFLSYSKEEENIPDRHISFGSMEVFTAKILDTVPGNVLPLKFSESSTFPVEAMTFSQDYSTLYLSIIPPRSSKEKIFKASMQSTKWVIEKEPLNFCDGDFIYTHPALSSDGTFLIFSSDMSGSSGNLDLFVSRRENNKWSQPENIGRKINTSENELFASLDADNNLYFSSNGIPGNGGYDIYVCKFNGTGWDKPYNLSAINTDNDELAFTINRKDDMSAFFTSRTRSGKNRIQLYSLTLNENYAKNPAKDLSQEFLAISGATTKPENATELALNQTAHNIQKESPGKQVNETLGKNIEISGRIENDKPSDRNQEVKELPKATATGNETPNPKPTITVNPEQKKPVTDTNTKSSVSDKVVYRVQVLANTKPVGSYVLNVAGHDYKSFEYLYMGGYRTTIGEFNTLSEAARLQNICRQNGYKEAFVVAFKNNIRTNDPNLFR